MKTKLVESAEVYKGFRTCRGRRRVGRNGSASASRRANTPSRATEG